MKSQSIWEGLKEIDRFFQGKDQVHQTMRRLVRRLQRAGIPYAVVGGMAVFFHHYRRTTNDVDVLLTPVCSVPAFHHDEKEWNIGGKRVSYMQAMSYTQWFNLLGNPGLVVPIGESPEGLPIGVQIVGRPNEEELVLKVGLLLEQAVGEFKASPMMME